LSLCASCIRVRPSRGGRLGLTKQRSVVVVGGGLAGGLVALRLQAMRPDLDLLLLEQGESFGGEHTWCFHDADIASGGEWILPFKTCSWPGYEVRFPGYKRRFGGAYHALRSADLHRHIEQRLGARAQTHAAVLSLEPHLVTLVDGRTFAADCVIDARGFPRGEASACAYQKFHGLFVTTAMPHGLTEPVLMDAAVEQIDGYRFIYVLPWSRTQLLVEDTRYSDGPSLDKAAMRGAIVDYIKEHIASVFAVTGEESGVLPIPLHGALIPATTPGVVTAGVRAGLFHPTTGYSLPDAVRFANWLAEAAEFDGDALSVAAADRASAHWARGTFCRRLNNMMFMAAVPEARRRIMAQFYRRDRGLIERFYASSLTQLDWLRLLSGRPPVAVGAGLRAFFAKAASG